VCGGGGGGGGRAGAAIAAVCRVRPAAATDAPAYARLALLPAVPPAACALLTAATVAPLLWAMWRAGAVREGGGYEGASSGAAGAAAPPQAAAVPHVARARSRSRSSAPAASRRRPPPPAASSALLARPPPSPLTAALPVCVAVAHLAAFGFGFHVHEKAVLSATVPLWAAVGAALAAGPAQHPAQRAADAELARLTWLLSAPAHVALLPLFFTPEEQPVVALLTAAFAAATWAALRSAHGARAFAADFGVGRAGSRLPLADQAYLLGLLPLHAVALAHGALFPTLPFVHLMAVSLYCAVGVGVAGCRLYAHALRRLAAAGGGAEVKGAGG
jgi:hypothetical protein